MVHTEETDENTIKELVLQRKFEEAGLWVNVRLDWVKNWDQNSQTTVVLSRLKHTGKTHIRLNKSEGGCIGSNSHISHCGIH